MPIPPEYVGLPPMIRPCDTKAYIRRKIRLRIQGAFISGLYFGANMNESCRGSRKLYGLGRQITIQDGIWLDFARANKVTIIPIIGHGERIGIAVGVVVQL